MNLANRKSLLWGALIAAIAASIWAVTSPADDDASTPSIPSTPSPLALLREDVRDLASAKNAPPEQRNIANAQPSDAAIRSQARQANAVRDDIFAAYSWEPPKPIAAATKEPPRAPPLPFTFAGHLKAEGPPSYILAEGTRMHVVAVGESVGEFQLQQASQSVLVFLHGPSNLTATLSIAQ